VDSEGSTVVEHQPYPHKVNGLSQASYVGTRVEKIVEKKVLAIFEK
jgi:hypothetical protein